MKTQQTLAQQQQMQMTLSPALIQSLKLLQAPLFDLRESVLREVEKNPALEIISDPILEKEREKKIENKSLSSYLHERTRVPSAGDILARDNYQQFLENIPESQAMSLQQYLLKQLDETPVLPEVAQAAALIIQNLTDDGFHAVSLDELLKNLPAEKHIPGLRDRALFVVRRLDPIGCAVYNFHESLMVQTEILAAADQSKQGIAKTVLIILKKYFACLEDSDPRQLVKRIKKAAQGAFSITEEQARQVLSFIHGLDPFPGRRISNVRAANNYIIPEVFVIKTTDGFSARINNDEIPVIKIMPFFNKMVQSEDAQTRRFANTAVTDARRFLTALHRRNETLLNVVSEIIRVQYGFFLYGKTHLTALKLQDVADVLDIAVATVSRATNGKYLQCEWGLFELKFFFRTELQIVKADIEAILQAHEKKPSDQYIADTLSLQGITISRRTVAKYRKEIEDAKKR